MKKKLISILLAACLLLALAACGSNNGGGAQDKTYVVGVCQLVQHDALDAATRGFEEALKAELGDAVEIQVQNASNDIPTCSTIVSGFVADGVDLIMANATPALQAAAAATQEIPILGTSITEYGVALDLKDFNGTVGGNISGTSDLAPLDQQAAMIKELFPEAKEIGLLYCSSEANSAYQIEVMTQELTKLGFHCTEFAFSDSSDVASMTSTASLKSPLLSIIARAIAPTVATAIRKFSSNTRPLAMPCPAFFRMSYPMTR